MAAEGPGYGRGAEKPFPPGGGGPPGPQREVGGGEGRGGDGAPVPGRRAVRAGRAGKRNPVTDLHGGEVSQKKKKKKHVEFFPLNVGSKFCNLFFLSQEKFRA